MAWFKNAFEGRIGGDIKVSAVGVIGGGCRGYRDENRELEELTSHGGFSVIDVMMCSAEYFLVCHDKSENPALQSH